MRTSDFLTVAAVLLVATTGPAFAFEAEQRSSVVPRMTTPVQAFRAGTELLRSGDKDDKEKALGELRYAAEQGHPVAQWKLGRMYADGDGVTRDHLKAFQYFSSVASEYAETAPWSPQARFVANAYVSLGTYYLNGIPKSTVRADVDRARGLFSYAASYFGDPDAQYQLARLYLGAHGAAKDIRQAARWLHASAQKGQHEAQALLGQMLFRGEGVPKQRSRGLMWLTLARDAAAGRSDDWIVEAYEQAFSVATEEERALAFAFLEKWLKTQR